MYKVYCDDYLIHNHNLNDLKLISPIVSTEINKTGSFVFNIPQFHPYYNVIKKLKSTIKVLRNEKIIFYGRALDVDRGFYNSKQVTCEGTLSFFRTTTQRPYDFSGSVLEFLTFLINNHNAYADENRKIYLGNVEIEDDNEYITRSNSDYSSTYDCLMDKLIDLLGGFFHFRYVDDKIYMDYIKDFVKVNTQKIEATKNLIDFNELESAADVITVLIPLGAKLTDEDGNETDERLTIESVNNGLDYIVNEDAVAIYGKNSNTVIWEDVTEPSNLLTKGNAYLLEAINFSRTLEIEAADLSNTDTTVECYEIGDYVTVYSVPHNVDYQMLCTKLNLNLNQPSSDVLSLGTTVSSLTETLLQSKSENASIIEIVNKINKDYVTNQQVTDKLNETLVSTSVEYATSASETEPPTDGWSEEVEWIDGEYVWQRTKSTYYDGTISYSDPVNIQGLNGIDGTGVSSIIAQYYLSTSKTEQIDGEWLETAPEWQYGYYLWTRTEITYTDNTVTYTEPLVSSEWEAANLVQDNLNIVATQVELNTSNIEQSASSILLEVAKIYATNDVIESLESTLISQTSESIEFVKTTLTDDIVDLTGTVTTNQQLIEEYIRFDGAEISLGTSDSDFTAVLDNEKLAFQENGQNVAYISNQKMNISDAEVENSLKIGNFKWQPRDNGNLSLVYIG